MPARRVTSSNPNVITGRPAGGSRAGVPSFVDDPDAWDRMIVAGRLLPGIAKVEGDCFKRRISSSQVAGQHGATVTDTGRKPRKVKVVLRIWTTEHLRELEELLPLILRQPKGKKTLPLGDLPNQGGALPIDTSLDPNGFFERFGRNVVNSFKNEVAARENLAKKQASADAAVKAYNAPLDVAHPVLRLAGLDKLHFLEADLLKHVGDGIWEQVFECQDFIPAPLRGAAVLTPKGAASTMGSIQSAIVPDSPPSSTDAAP